MPYTYKKKRTYRKRKNNTRTTKSRFKKSYSSNRQNALVTKVGHPFPPNLATKNNWAETSVDIAQALPGTVFQANMLRLNSAYDPALSTALGQESVQYHNIYNRYYAKYYVSYVKVNLKWRNTGNNDCRIVAGISDQTNPIFLNVNMNEFQMAKYTQTKVLESDQGSRYNRGNMTFKLNLNHWAKRNKFNAENVSAAVNANPTQYPTLWFAIQSEDDAQTALAKVDITATFYTKYNQRIESTIMKAQ